MRPKSPAESVAANVRAELARQRKTQSALAQALGIPQHAVSRRLRGKVPFDVNEVTAAAAFLSLPITRLLSEDVAA